MRSEPHLADIHDHPAFAAAVASYCRMGLIQVDAISPAQRWLINDMRRVAVLTRALIRFSQAGAVTAGDLLTITGARNTSSGGRVIQVIQRAERAGLFAVEPGVGGWTHRPLRPLPALMAIYRNRAVMEVTAASLVIPQLEARIPRLQDGAYLRGFLAALGRFDGISPEERGPPTPSIRLFLGHDGGMHLLYILYLLQSDDRPRLLESAPFSRLALSRRVGVSRAHVSRLFSAAEAAGYLSLASPGKVVFSAAMSDEFRQHYALTFRVICSCLQAADAGWNPPAPRERENASGVQL